VQLDIESLNYLSATGAIVKFRTGELSPIELLEVVIERANAISDSVNPFADKVNRDRSVFDAQWRSDRSGLEYPNQDSTGTSGILGASVSGRARICH
jgi:hypothetical protein